MRSDLDSQPHLFYTRFDCGECGSMRILLLAGVAAWAWTSSAQASYTFTFDQVGSDVVATGVGSFDVNGFSANPSSIFSSTQMNPEYGTIYFGAVQGSPIDFYNISISPHIGFGTGFIAYGSSSSGMFIGFSAGDYELELPRGYISGTALQNTTTFANQTLAGLGLSKGTHVYSYNTGADADMITVQIDQPPATPVPEPVSLAILTLPMGVAGMLAIRRRRNTPQDDRA